MSNKNKNKDVDNGIKVSESEIKSSQIGNNSDVIIDNEGIIKADGGTDDDVIIGNEGIIKTDGVTDDGYGASEKSLSEIFTMFEGVVPSQVVKSLVKLKMPDIESFFKFAKTYNQHIKVNTQGLEPEAIETLRKDRKFLLDFSFTPSVVGDTELYNKNLESLKSLEIEIEKLKSQISEYETVNGDASKVVKLVKSVKYYDSLDDRYVLNNNMFSSQSLIDAGFEVRRLSEGSPKDLNDINRLRTPKIQKRENRLMYLTSGDNPDGWREDFVNMKSVSTSTDMKFILTHLANLAGVTFESVKHLLSEDNNALTIAKFKIGDDVKCMDVYPLINGNKLEWVTLFDGKKESSENTMFKHDNKDAKGHLIIDKFQQKVLCEGSLFSNIYRGTNTKYWHIANLETSEKYGISSGLAWLKDQAKK